MPLFELSVQGLRGMIKKFTLGIGKYLPKSLKLNAAFEKYWKRLQQPHRQITLLKIYFNQIMVVPESPFGLLVIAGSHVTLLLIYKSSTMQELDPYSVIVTQVLKEC